MKSADLKTREKYGAKKGATESLVMPEKPVGRRRLKQAKVSQILINGYVMDLSEAVKKVQKYEIKFIGVKKDGKERDLTRGPKNDVAIILRRSALWKVYETFLNLETCFFGRDQTRLYYDCGINFYSIDVLCRREEGEKTFTHPMELFDKYVRDFFPRFDRIICKILAVQEISLHDISAVSAGLEEQDRSLVQFLEVVTTQLMLKKESHWIFSNKSYQPLATTNDRRLQLGGGKILVPGMEKNVRFISDRHHRIVTMTQIGAKKSPFFEEQNLLDLVDELINRRPYKEVVNDPKVLFKLQRQLRELVVRTNYDDSIPRYFSIFGISTQSADNITFPLQCEEVSVSQYFLHRYNLRLRHPELPCVIERKYSSVSKEVTNNFYPMEVLVVCRGQRVDLKKQTPDLVEKMISGCRLLPQELLEENENQRKCGGVNNENPYLNTLGIKIAAEPLSTEGTVIFPPAIGYKESKLEPKGTGDLDWRLSIPRSARCHLFAQPAKPPRRWVVFVFQDAVRPEVCDRFIVALLNQAKKHGTNINDPSRIEKVDRDDLQAVDDIMQKMRKNCVEYVLFISAGKHDPLHNAMKLAEAKYNIVTQHVCSVTVEKALSNRGAEMTLDNLVMKLNLKLGGVNHILKAPVEFLRRNRMDAKIFENEWVSPSKMFVGLVVSHPSVQSLYARLSGKPPNEPSVVGMAYTIGECVRMKGNYWMQEPRKAIASDLEMHMTKAINNFRSESKLKCLPERVVVYRGGVSEGEYKKVIAEEATAIRNACKAVAEKSGSSSKIRLSIIVVQARSNYRVFPTGSLPKRDARQWRSRSYEGPGGDQKEDINERKCLTGFGNAATQNVLPGTCIDDGGVHPTYTEFLLVPQKSTVGTARPIRYTVVVDDEPRMSMDEVETVTNLQCYAHGIVTSPVSVPAQLYAANDLAKRGRNVWKIANYGDDDAGSIASDEGGVFRNDGSADFFNSITVQLASKCRYKFWA